MNKIEEHLFDAIQQKISNKYIFHNLTDKFMLISFGYNNTKTECLINGIKQKYDACSTWDLEKAIESYKNFTYIGSSYVCFINGVKNVSDKLCHFFVRK